MLRRARTTPIATVANTSMGRAVGCRDTGDGAGDSCVVAAATPPAAAQKSQSTPRSLMVVIPAPRNAASIANPIQAPDRKPDRSASTKAVAGIATKAARPTIPLVAATCAAHEWALVAGLCWTSKGSDSER